MHRKSERIAISKRKFIFKHYKTLKSLNKMIKVGINGFGRIAVSYTHLVHYLKVNYFGICATSHVAMPKNTN